MSKKNPHAKPLFQMRPRDVTFGDGFDDAADRRIIKPHMEAINHEIRYRGMDPGPIEAMWKRVNDLNASRQQTHWQTVDPVLRIITATRDPHLRAHLFSFIIFCAGVDWEKAQARIDKLLKNDAEAATTKRKAA